MKFTAQQLGMTQIEHALTELMSRPKIPWQCKLHPEEKISIEFADVLRKATMDGKLKAVWVHVPNEGKRHPFTAIILKAMGLISGALDYWFAWDGGSGLIEFKSKKGKITNNQEYFLTWCEYRNVPKAICYSPEEAILVLQRWGVFV